MKEWRGAVVVRFLEYGNEEEVQLCSLQPLVRAKVGWIPGGSYCVLKQLKHILTLGFQKRKGSGYMKHRPKTKRKKARSKEGMEERAVWRVEGGKD